MQKKMKQASRKHNTKPWNSTESRRDLFHVKSFVVQKVAHVMPSILLFSFFSPYDLFIFSINYTKKKRNVKEEQRSKTRLGSAIVIIRWRKEIKVEMIRREKCIVNDHGEIIER
jgi:hypothetical protein